MIPNIIGLLGRSRVGKDTVASSISTMHPEFNIVRLSMPLKKAACELYGYTMEQIESHEKETTDSRWNKTPRESIQSLTDYMMSYMGPDFFTKKLYYDFDNQKYGSHIIIPDIRYEHDILEIIKRNGIIIKIERPNNPYHHNFENHIDFLKGTYRVVNDGTLEQLEEKVNQILKSISSG
jgi:hypothetical protein